MKFGLYKYKALKGNMYNKVVLFLAHSLLSLSLKPK